MFKKLGKLLIIIGIIGGVGYVGFLVFVNPGGFTNKEELINSYFENITSTTVCEDHFNTETESFCSDFQTLIGSRVIVVTTLTASGSEYEVVLTLDGVETEFVITFVEVEVTGVKSFLNSTYYRIDLIT